MTDEGDRTPGVDLESGERPAPLPLDAVPAGRAAAADRSTRRTAVWVIAGVVAVLLVTCGVAYLFARWVGEELDTASAPEEALGVSEGSLSGLMTPASVWWSGNGAYAVVQSVGADDRPLVSVIKRATGTVRKLKGYRVVDVEPHAPRVWLVPDKRKTGLADYSEPTTATLLDIAGDGVDTPPAELYALRLDSDADPRADVDARWTAWDGPAGYTVSVEIDVNKGACASTLRFGKAGSSLNAWSAKVPTDVVTFEPVGWSPSGRYFAVVTQADVKATDKAIDAYIDDDSAAGAPTYDASILVFSAADGTLAARDQVNAPLHVANAGASIGAWSGGEDALVHADRVQGRMRLEVLRPDGTDTPVVSPKAAWTKDEGWTAGSLWLAGTETSGTLAVYPGLGVLASGELADVYRVGTGGEPAQIGMLPASVAARWSQDGGMLCLLEDSMSDWTVYVTDRTGGSRVELLTLESPDSVETD